jgi:hypothetical protein
MFENFYSNKLKNLEEIEKFLDAFELPKVNQENINHLNRLTMSNEIAAVIESPNK